MAAPFPFPLAPLNFPLASPFQFSSQGGFCQPSASVLKGSWIVRPAAGKSTVKVDGFLTFSVCLQGTVSNLSWLERVGTKMHLAKINFNGFLFSYEGRTIQERVLGQSSSVRPAFVVPTNGPSFVNQTNNSSISSTRVYLKIRDPPKLVPNYNQPYPKRIWCQNFWYLRVHIYEQIGCYPILNTPVKRIQLSSWWFQPI